MMASFPQINSLEKIKKENVTFRILSALGIIFVVMGHTGCYIFEMDGWIPYYSFHMPLFAFISGYFYKRDNHYKIIPYIWRKIKGILIPFYLVSLFYMMINYLLENRGITFGLHFSLYNWLIRPWVKTQPLGFNIATWFMISLFIVEVTYVLVKKVLSLLLSNSELDGCLLIVLIAIAGIVIDNAVYPEEWQRVLLRSQFLILFYHIGFCYKQYIEAKDTISTMKLFLIIGAIRLLLVTNFGDCKIGVWNCDFHGLPWWVVLTSSMIGITFWLRVARILSAIPQASRTIVVIGRHTREIMSHHLFLNFLCQGSVSIIYSVFGIKNNFDISLYKTELYYHFRPWGGYSLLFAILSIALTMIAVCIREYTWAKVQRVITYAKK